MRLSVFACKHVLWASFLCAILLRLESPADLALKYLHTVSGKLEHILETAHENNPDKG